MRYMLDTNICIYLIQNRASSVQNRMRGFRTDEIGVSVVTVAELQYGVAKSQQQERNQVALEAFLLPLDIANLALETTVVYGEIRANLKKQGRPIAPLDTLIAAHALSLDVPPKRQRWL